MKDCPNCKMTVDAMSECPVCGHDITNQPQSERQFEKYCFNKHFFGFLLKKQRFCLLCTAIVLAFVLFANRFHYLEIVSLVLIIFMWFDALYKNLSFKIFGGIYTEDYLETVYKFGIYSAGILAVICAAVLPFLA